MINTLKSTALFAFICLFASCEKVIDLDLDESESQLVIEANLDASTNSISVLVTKSTDYFNSSELERINDAEIILTDAQNNMFSIPEVSSGLYFLELSEVETNQLYSLDVIVDNQTYSAQSFLPEVVEIVSLSTAFQEENTFFEEGYQVRFLFQDPGNETNFYRILHSINGELQKEGSDMQILDDDLFNGGQADLPIFQHIFESGEVITVDLLHFDESSFDYFNSLSDIVNSGGGPGGASAAPGNPITNWSGDILGYFSAYSKSTQEITLP